MIANDISTKPAGNQTGHVPSRRWLPLVVAVIAGVGGALVQDMATDRLRRHPDN